MSSPRPSRGIETIRSAKVDGRTVQGAGRTVRWTQTGDVQHVAKTDDGRWYCLIVTGDGRGAIAFADGGTKVRELAWQQLDRERRHRGLIDAHGGGGSSVGTRRQGHCFAARCARP
jgi:hypothetical protein